MVRSALQSYIESRQQAIVSELVSLVSIPNVTSDTENRRLNALQLRRMLQRRGLRAEVIETDGNPIVFDLAQHSSGKPTVAFGFRGALGLELTVYGPKGGAQSAAPP